MNAFRCVVCLALSAFLIPLLAGPHHEQGENPEGLPSVRSLTLEAALETLQSDIRRDTEALNDFRKQVEAERIPLVEELDALRKTLIEQRAEMERIRQVRNQGERQQANLESRAAALEQEASFLRGLFSEYSRAMDTRMNSARDPEIMKKLAEARVRLEDPRIPLPQAIEELFALSLNWNSQRIGGSIFEGAALDEAGIEHEGRFATFGPLGYFESSSGELAGLVTLRFGSDRPALFSELDEASLASIGELLQGAAAEVPVDSSDGDAIRVEEAKPSLEELLKQGGYTMYPLAVVAGVALLLSLWKFIELSTMRVKADKAVGLVLDALRSGDEEKARHAAASVKNPLRLLVDDLIEYHQAPREHLEEIMGEHLLAAQPSIERNLGALAVLGGVAPLLGLLGTVSGMINTFQLVEIYGSGDSSTMAGGISEALVTTMSGLAIAIPTLLVHAYLARRAKGILSSLESMSATLVNDLKLRKGSA